MMQTKPVVILLFLSLLLGNVISAYAQANSNADQPFSLFLPLIAGSDDSATQEADTNAEILLVDEAFVESEFTVDESVLSAAAATTTLLPTRYATTSGADGGQPVAALAVLDSPNTQNDADWLKYLEMYTPGSAKYIGYRSYMLPASIDPATITALQVKANYQGPAKATQSWTWTIYNWSTKKWVKLGDNTGAPSWQWKLFTFTVGGTLRNYINSSTREIQIRVQSNNNKDDMDLDYEALLVTYNGGTTPPPNNWWKPTPKTSWQIQLQDPLDTSFNVQVYFIDLFDVEDTQIRQLQQQGRKVICYFSAGSWEHWRKDAGNFPDSVKGKILTDWDERWLDIRNLAVLGPIMAKRLDQAVSKGCNGVDPDNVDGYDNDTGFPLTAQDQLTYNRWLAQQAHQRGLAIGLKNDLEQIPQLVNDFDWAVNEQCFEFNECPKLLPFINAGKPVFGIEYKGGTSDFCPQANAWNFDFLKKEVRLGAWRTACR